MSKSIPEQIQDLRNAIAAQEMLRPTLGDAIVDATITVLNQKLTALEGELGKSEEQRKLVTILFSDIKGSTAMAEKMDPEEWSDIMKAAFQFLIDPIYRHQGIVARLMGDAILAFFGADVVREDDAERAVRAGLDILAGLKPFQETIRQRHGGEFGVRVGINTGMALLSSVGTDQAGEFTALGDAVNLAARMEQSAPPNHLLIAPDTYTLVRDRFEIEPQPPISVKGKSEAVPVYIVVRELPRTVIPVRRGMAGLNIPMVGRQAEMERLQEFFREGCRGRSECILITGEAGSGKSRLQYEFCRWVQDQGSQARIMPGRTDPAIRNTPYRLLRDLFGSACGIQESDPVTVVRQKLEAGLAPHLAPDRADLVGQLIGFNLSDSPAVQAFGRSTAWAGLAEAYLSQYFRAAASAAPLLLLLEDLQWADEASLNFLLELPRQIPDQPVMVLGVGRTELLERLGDNCCQKLALDQIPAEAEIQLLNALVPKSAALGEALKTMIIHHANGNPYYLQEIVQMLQDEGLIGPADGRPPGSQTDLGTLQLPPTLQGVLQARLDSLSPEEKRFLQRAAVLGVQFWDQALAHLHAGQDAGQDLQQPIHSLETRQLIYPAEVSAFKGLDEYLFKHALLRQAAYDTLLLKLRRVYHGQAARWLLEKCGDRLPEYLGKIADHFERAGENHEAVIFHLQQARDAYARSAYRDAVRTLEHAVTLTPPDEPAQLARLHYQLGSNFDKLGDYDAAEEHLKLGLELAETSGQPGVAAEALCVLAWVAAVRGQFDLARENGLKALELAEQVGDKHTMARALTQVAGAKSSTDPESALEIFQQVLEYARESQDTAQIATTLLNIGNTELNLGRIDPAAQRYLESRQIYEKNGNRWGLENSINNLAILCKLRHEFEQGLEYARQALQMAEEIGDLEGQALCLFSLAHCRGGLKQIPEARADLRRAWEIVQKTGLELSLDLLNIICRLLAAGGRDREAAEVAGLIRTESDLIFEIAQDVEEALEEVALRLSPEELDAALTRGAGLDREIIIQRFLEESQ